MKVLIPWFFGMTLLSLSVIAYAQNYEQGSGIAGCQAGSGVCAGPQWQGQQRSSQQQTPQPPPEKWESRWGSIATDVPRGAVGVSTNMLSRSDAERTAMADCAAKGGVNCKIDTWYSNGCAVMVVDDNSYNVTARDTLEKATKVGMKYCADGTKANHCHVYFSTCSPAVRIQ